MYHIRWVTGYIWSFIYIAKFVSLAPTSTSCPSDITTLFKFLRGLAQSLFVLAHPPSSKIHNVFHCSLLKLHQGLLFQVTDPLPPHATDNHPFVKPLHILSSKWNEDASPLTLSVLVQWNGLPSEETSWEKWDELREIPPWGQGDFSGRRCWLGAPTSTQEGYPKTHLPARLRE